MPEDNNGPPTPRQPRLQMNAAVEANGNGHAHKDPRVEPNPSMPFEERVESALLEMQASQHHLLAQQEIHTKHLRTLTTEVALIRNEQQRVGLATGTIPPPKMRPPAPSFSSVEMDDGEKIITRNGTEKIAYSEDELRDKMRKEYALIRKQEQDDLDASAMRALKGRGKATVWAVVTAAVIGTFSFLAAVVKHWIDTEIHK